jgi:hypothetical protein
MSYKVTFATYALIDDKTTGKSRLGNVIQSTRTVFTDREISEIPLALDTHLEPKKQAAKILNIEFLDGICL